MFKQANQLYTFGINPLALSNDLEASLSRVEDQQVNPLLLKQLWTNHLIHEQAEFNKAEAQRHPLALDLKARNFFGH